MISGCYPSFSLKQSPGFIMYEFVQVVWGTENIKDKDKVLSNWLTDWLTN
jgi:hypothetical protein